MIPRVIQLLIECLTPENYALHKKKWDDLEFLIGVANQEYSLKDIES